jgi:hypothetical protein
VPESAAIETLQGKLEKAEAQIKLERGTIKSLCKGRDELQARLTKLEKLATYAVVEGYWSCPEGCENPDADPDDGALCSKCLDNFKESRRIPDGAGHPELLEYLEAHPWKR